MKKKLLSVFILLLVAVLTFHVPSKVFAEETNSITAISTATSDKYNVMLLIDKSGSMNATDESELAKSAACQFIDQMCTVSNDLIDISAVTSVGVMTFAQETELLSPVTSLDSDVNTSYLKSEIKGIKYLPSGTGGTDLSIAVYDALTELQKTSVNGEKNIVVMFTDGYSENVLDKTLSDSKLTEAFGIADSLEAEIYVVGLNCDAAIQEDDPKKEARRKEGRQEIYNLANTTQKGEGVSQKEDDDTTATKEEVNYRITDSLNEVREFYGKIYAEIIKSDFVYIENSRFTVETGGILEVDVTIYSNSKISDVTITDPNNNKKIKDGKTYFVSGDDYYKVIKIINPMSGEWTVDVTSNDKEYKSYVVQFYGVEVAITATWDTGENYPESGLKNPYVGKVILTPMYKGEPYMDEFLKGENTIAEFSTNIGGIENQYSLSYVDGKFVGYFPVEQGNYDIEAHIANEIMDRTVNCKLAVTNAEGMVDINLGTIEVKNQNVEVIDLLDKTGANTLTIDSINIISENNSEVISVTEDENNIIKIVANEIGKDEIEIYAMDSYGVVYKITATVKVEFAMLWYHWIGMGVGISVLGIVAIIFHRKRKKIPGTFQIFVELLYSENGNEGTQKELAMRAISGNVFSLWKLINRVKLDIDSRNNSTEGEKEISRVLADEKRKIAKLKIQIVKDSNKREVYKVNNRNISTMIECYKSPKLSIQVRFKSDREDWTNTNDWGKATDFKKKTLGRRASSVFDDDV